MLSPLLGLILAVLMVATRLRGSTHSLWWDEAYTAWAYVRRAGAFRNPEVYLGNNHVLFSFLTSRTSNFFGSTWEPLLRFWSLVPGLIGTAVLIWWLWRRLSVPLALVTMGVLLVSMEHARHIPEARGYGLVFLGSSLLLVAGARAGSQQPSATSDLMFVTGGWIGVAAIPTLGFAAAVQGLAALITRGNARARLVLASGAAAITIAWWYWPLREPMLSYSTSVGSRTGDSITPLNFLILPLEHLAAGPVMTMLPGRFAATSAFLSAFFVLLGTSWLVREHRDIGIQIVAGVTGSMVLMGLQGIHVQPRYIFFLLPHVAVALAAGFVTVARWLDRHLPGKLDRTIIALFVIMALSRGLLDVIELRAEPRQAFSDSVEAVLAAEPDEIYADRLHMGYRWYLLDKRDVTVVPDRDELERLVCDTPGSFAYVPYAQSHVYPEPLRCFDDPEWLRVDPPSFHPTTVWIRPS